MNLRILVASGFDHYPGILNAFLVIIWKHKRMVFLKISLLSR